MKKCVFLFVVGLSVYFRTATTDAETVWLKDVTTIFQTKKRTLSDPDLPDQLSFRLKRKSHALTLNLKRNHQIDPNADVYIVRKLKDGRSLLAKTRNLKKEMFHYLYSVQKLASISQLNNIGHSPGGSILFSPHPIWHLAKVAVAYYQDMENGAFMTARCVKRSSGQCDILINGNIRIGDRNYDLRPSEADVTSRNVLEITGLLAKQYVLQDQANIQREMSVENKGEANVNDKNVEENFIDLLRRIPHEQDKQKNFLRPDVKLSIRNVAGLHNIETTEGNSYSGTKNKDDKIRSNGKEYYVEVFILLDSSIWDLFLTTAYSGLPLEKATETKLKIREYFSHIINGVDLLYKGIEDTGISINVNIRGFMIFQSEANFPHRRSRVELFNGRNVIQAINYLGDVGFFDIEYGSVHLQAYDQLILFTKHGLYFGSKHDDTGAGISHMKSVCDVGYRVQLVHFADYFLTVTNTAHELGHSLGADHDGDTDARDCNASDFFIMSPLAPVFKPTEKYSRNPWLFSNCSVEAFKKTLNNKTCVTSKGNYSEGELSEWNSFMRKLPGERYTPNDQCHLYFKPGSTYCGKIPGIICRFMYCTDPTTRQCVELYFNAATGTPCGRDAWCKEGLCVKISKIGPNCSVPHSAK